MYYTLLLQVVRDIVGARRTLLIIENLLIYYNENR